jgi:hypothetical protein
MKKILLSLFTILMVAVAATSCLSDDLGGKPNPPATEGGFMLDLKVENSSLTRNTTVAPAEGESDINSLHLLFFEADGNQSFLWHHDASPTSGTLDIASKIKIEFELGSPLNHTTPYKILIVANIDGYVADKDVWLATFAAMNYNEARRETLNIPDNNDLEIKQDNLLMSAEVDRNPSGADVQATLRRAFTRFDVDLHDTKHTLTSVEVWNVARTTGIWDSEYNDNSQFTSKFAAGNVIDGKAVKGSLYAFENRASTSEQNDKSTTCLIIGINNGTKTSYYRVNIVSSAIGQQNLKRNYVFNVGIIRVLAEGADTPEAAYNSSNEPSLDYTINNWSPDGGGLVLIDDRDNLLVIPTSSINFSAAGGEIEYHIFTHSADPLNPLALGVSDMSRPEGFEIILSGNILRVKVAPSIESKRGFIELAFGPDLRGRIDINQTGDNDAYLELSVGTNGIPAFPSTIYEWNGNVTVSSSGAWTASLYGADFKFIRNIANSDRTATGYDGGTFSVATATVNSTPAPRFGFVIVTLNTHPDMNRVIVLRQAGTAGVKLTPYPADGILWFATNGAAEITNANTINVDAGGEEWTAQLSGSHADKYELVEDYDNNTITITALRNTTLGIYDNTFVRVSLSEMNNVGTSFEVRTRAQVLTLNPTNVPNVSFTGGTTQAITVTSSEPWTASSETPGVVITPSSGNNGGTFTVTVPQLPMNMSATGRDITVTVIIPDTEVSRRLTITQNRRPANPISIIGGVNTLDAFHGNASAANRATSQQLISEMQSGSNFGSSVNSTVFSGARNFTPAINLNPGSANIYMANNAGTGGAGYNAARATTVRNWLTAPGAGQNRVLIVTNQTATGGLNAILGGTNGWGYTGAQGGAANGSTQQHRVDQSIVDGARPAWQKPLLDYLFRTGPFMPAGVTDISGQVALLPNNATGGTLTNYPSTFIPIIMHPNGNGRVVMGIDPVRRIVYYGNGIFGTGVASGNTQNWASTNPNSAANLAFLRNLAAWMIEAAQHGQEFTVQFIQNHP